MGLASLADIYENAKHAPNDRKTVKVYNALKQELDNQFRAIRQTRFDVQFNAEAHSSALEAWDPVQAYWDMRASVNATGILWVSMANDVQADHPLASRSPFGVSWNCILRAVHDANGHLAHNVDFTYEGEFEAYRRHRMLFSNDATQAFATETIAQTAWQMNNPSKGFPAQKAFAMPLESLFGI